MDREETPAGQLAGVSFMRVVEARGLAKWRIPRHIMGSAPVSGLDLKKPLAPHPRKTVQSCSKEDPVESGRNERMRWMIVFGFMSVILSQAGCAPIAMTAGGIAGGAGINHALNGIAYKTFSAPVRKVRVAAIRSLNRMEMKVTNDVKSEDGWRIDAVAADRTIEIDLEELTPAVTRMRVVTNKGGIFFKDSATSTEIILQIARRIDSANTAQR